MKTFDFSGVEEFIIAILNIAKSSASLTEPLKIGLYPHVHADGDAIGSCFAFALILEKLGFRCKILVEEQIERTLAECFSDKLSSYVLEEELEVANWMKTEDYAFRLDSSENTRLGRRLAHFVKQENLGRSWTLDHHLITKERKESKLFYCNEHASSTCELVTECVELIEKRLNLSLTDYDIATALLVGIITDTGRFSYANVTSNTFLKAAYLMKYNPPLAKNIFKLYDEKSLTYFSLRAYIFANISALEDKQLIIARLPYHIFKEQGASQRETEGLSAELRCIEGCRCAVFLQGLRNGDIKASIRSNEAYSAYDLASYFGGGGHEKAAGFSLSKDILLDKYGNNTTLSQEYILSADFDASFYEAKQLQEFWLESLKNDLEKPAKLYLK